MTLLSRRCSFCIALMALLLCWSVGAQTIVTGDIVGTVRDASDAAVPNATVTLKGDDSGITRTANTNSQGQYRFALLSPGAYTISVTAQGFTATRVKTTASLGQISTADVKLGIGAVNELVDVVATAPELLQTEDANNSNSISRTQMDVLPMGGGDLVSLVYSVPGVNMSTGAGYGNFTSFGLPGTSNLFTVNGTDYMDPYLNLNNSGASNLSLGATSCMCSSLDGVHTR